MLFRRSLKTECEDGAWGFMADCGVVMRSDVMCRVWILRVMLHAETVDWYVGVCGL
jgi:hypothetical protein